MTIDDDDLDEYSRRRFPQNGRVEPEQREIMNALGRYFIDHMNTDRRYSPPPQLTPLPLALTLEEELDNRFERLARRDRNEPNVFNNTGIVLLAILFFISSAIRYLLQAFSNAIISSFREKVDWAQYLKDSSCDGEEGLKKVVCKAYRICVQEVVPQFFPVSADDIWIQILIIIIILLIIDRIELQVKRRRD